MVCPCLPSYALRPTGVRELPVAPTSSLRALASLASPLQALASPDGRFPSSIFVLKALCESDEVENVAHGEGKLSRSERSR